MKRWIMYLIIGLVTYGSLYPFHFSIPASHSASWATLFHNVSLWSSRMDVLGNLLLFVPFGFVGALSIAVNKSLATRITLVSLIGLAVALPLQIAQIYVPERSPALSDVLWNMIGSIAGIVAGLNVRLSSQHLRPGTALPLGLIALWLAAELLPFVPSLDVQSIRNNLKGVLQPKIAYDQLLFHTAGMLMAGRALAAVVGDARALRWLFLLASVVVAGKVFVVTLTLSISTLAGLAIGLITWWWIGYWREPRRGTMVMLFLFATYAYGALAPFEFRGDPEPFSLLPFAGLLRGSMLANIQTLTANLCLYAGVLWIISTMGGRIVPCSIALAGLVLIFEIIQIYVVGRTPDITEPLLVLLLGQLLHASSQSISKRHSPSTQNGTHSNPETPPRFITATNTTRSAQLPVRSFNALAWVACLGAVCLTIAFLFSQILRLPQLPYNVVELFLGNGAFPFLVVFSLALLWTGAGARLVSHYVARSSHPWLALPALAFGAGVVSLLLLFASVTEESVADIAGSNNLHWFVINKAIWGEWARDLFVLLPPIVISCLERPVRYASLYGPLVTFLALMFIAVTVFNRDRSKTMGISSLVISAILWLWLCKAIAFDWSSTDNLNELIARDGPAGWGGGGYLYALLAVICANAVLLTYIRFAVIWVVLAIGVTSAALPVGWWLLNNGLEQYVQKYDLVFSGVQFLLGPDRKQTLNPEILFFRWSIVQMSAVLVIAAGARLVMPVIDWLSDPHIRQERQAK